MLPAPATGDSGPSNRNCVEEVVTMARAASLNLGLMEEGQMLCFGLLSCPLSSHQYLPLIAGGTSDMVHRVGQPLEKGHTGEPVQPLPSASCMSSPPVVLQQPKEVGMFLILRKRKLRHLDPVIPPDFPSALPVAFPPFSSPLL